LPALHDPDDDANGISDIDLSFLSSEVAAFNGNVDKANDAEAAGNQTDVLDEGITLPLKQCKLDRCKEGLPKDGAPTFFSTDVF